MAPPAQASGFDGARVGTRGVERQAATAGLEGTPGGAPDDNTAAAAYCDEDDVDEPALQRDLSVGEEREASVALARSRSHTPSQPTLTPHESTRAVLSRWDARLLKATTYSLLAFATLWGVLARLGLEWIGKFADGQVFFLVWPQIFGCLVMGFAVDRKKGIEKAYVPLFVALGTGFCGSLTTFSSWMHDVFVAFANLESGSNARFRGFLSGLAVTLITLASANTALRVGVHLSTFLPRRRIPRRSSKASQLSHSSKRPLPRPQRHLFFLALGPLFYLGAILLLALGPHSWRSRATFAIVLGPPGTVLRYELSRHLNAKSPSFPLGTFAANSLAVLIFAITAILQRRPTGALGCAALQGVQDGFCGSLSTVSTFVVELRNLGTKDSWRYAGISWLTGQAIMILLLGSYVWSGSNYQAAC